LHTGVLLKLDLPNGGTSGAWKLAEELSKSVPDWLGALQVEQVSEVDGGIKIHFTCQEQWQGEVTAQCNLYHTFYIKDRGQCSVPHEVQQHFWVAVPGHGLVPCVKTTLFAAFRSYSAITIMILQSHCRVKFIYLCYKRS
jgi:hypothetical protein